jgi:DtxR family Mn-dependent transcriptional regulator
MASHVPDRLSDLAPGQRGVVAEVEDRDPALLRYLGGLGLRPAEQLEVLAVAPFDGPLTLRVGEMEHIVGRRAAEAVRVSRPAA